MTSILTGLQFPDQDLTEPAQRAEFFQKIRRLAEAIQKFDFQGSSEFSIPLTAAEVAKGLVDASLTDKWRYPGDVKRYGAKGDGVTIDRVAIQTAIDVMEEAGGGPVYLPEGRYLLDDSLSMKAGVHMIGTGFGSCLSVPNSSSFTDNLLKFESIQGASVRHIQIDGNRATSVSGTRYGIYFGSAVDCQVLFCWVHDCVGVGIQIYDSDNAIVMGCSSYENLFHGLELEQCRDSIAFGNQLYSNDNNGLYVSPGEVGSEGSHGVIAYGNACNNNTDHGISIQGPLTDDCAIMENSCRGNGEYGITVFDRVKTTIVQGNVVANNGFHGIYAWRMSYCSIRGNTMHNNSQATNAGYQEIFLDGDSTQYSTNNVVDGNVVRINGTNKAAYAIKENSTNDGPNIIRNNICPDSGTAGRIAILHETGTPNSFLMCRGNIGHVSENRGTFTGNGNGVLLAFSFNHGLSDEPRTKIAVAGNQVSAAEHWVTANSTQITVTFSAAPASGTGNIVFHWYASI